jgi:predicted enzyme related to lactoylglutathione lyase
MRSISASIANCTAREHLCDYGRFAWITDPDGNRIELWEPPKPKED